MGKTALVLAGGGLKGGAYEVGVLRALAESGVVPDVLVGISAGAVNASYVATMVASGQFTPDEVERTLGAAWTTSRTLRELLSLDGGEPEGENSLQRILQKAGLDPLWTLLWPWPALEAIRALRSLVGGHFTSILTHGIIRDQLLGELQPPEEVFQPVILSVAATDMMASTQISPQGLDEDHSHYETFFLAPNTPENLNAQYDWLRSVVTASCSVPVVFPPVRLHPGRRERPGMFMDGGMIPHAPLTHALSLDPEIDTLIAVMAVAPVAAAQQEPHNILQVFGRYFTIIAGRYLIQDYLDLLGQGRRRSALRQVLETDSSGQIMPSLFNDRVCRAAGFGSYERFMAQRAVRLIAIAPSHALPGGTFSAFKAPELVEVYRAQGEADAFAALLAPEVPCC